MKKTFTINLGGMPFIIDEDAYAALHRYLEAIKQSFRNVDEANEIIQDIEARLAELFSEYLKNRAQVIGVQDVESAIGAMGQPADIAGADTETTDEQKSAYETSKTTKGIKRKLFRNPDDKVLGGVLSGVSMYLGIEDSIWLRLIFVALFFLGLGSTFFIYIILWVIVPVAKTTSEKLQMRGEPVNLDSIQKEVTEAATRINKWGREESVGERLLNLILMLVKGAFKILAVVIAFVVMLVLFVFIASSVGFLSIASIPSISELADVYVESSTVVYSAAIGLLLLIITPLIAVLYGAMRLILGVRTKIPHIKWALSLSFLAGLLLMIFAGVSFGVNFKNSAVTSEQYPLMQPAGNTLFVQLADSSGAVFDEEFFDEIDEDNFGVFVNGEIAKTKTGYKIGRPHIKLMPSKSDLFYVERNVHSKGKTKSAAARHAKEVNYNFTQTDTVLNLNSYVEVKNGGKWRSQMLYFNIAIPEGKLVRFSENIDFVPATVKDNRAYNRTLFANTTWTVKNGKVVCLDCEDTAEED